MVAFGDVGGFGSGAVGGLGLAIVGGFGSGAVGGLGLAIVGDFGLVTVGDEAERTLACPNGPKTMPHAASSAARILNPDDFL